MDEFNIFDVEENDSILEMMGVDKNTLEVSTEEIPEEEPKDKEPEDKEPEEVPTDDTNPSPDSKNIKEPETSKSNILSSIVDAIREEGYFDETDEKLDIKTPQDFIKVLDKIRDSALETEQSDWSDEQKEYFEALRNGVPHEVVSQHQQRQSNLLSITDDAIEAEENEELRKQIILADLKAKNFSDKRAADLLQKYIDSGEDIEVAKEAISTLRETDKQQFKALEEQKKKETLEATKKAEEQKKEFKKYVDEISEVIPGMKLTPKNKKDIYDSLTKPVKVTEDGRGLNIIGDFFERATYKELFKMAALLKYTEGLSKMETISPAKAAKAVTSKLDKLLESPSTAIGFAKDGDAGEGLANAKTMEDIWGSLDKFL